MRAGLFPGQGVPAQIVLAALPERDETLELAERRLGYPLRRKVAVAARRKGALLPTGLAQPAIFVAGVIALEQHRREGGDEHAFYAGHSLGEYTALVAAGAISFEDAVDVVAVRGDAMQDASRNAPGSMAALMGLSLDAAEDVAQRAGVEVANDNAPGQVVVAGSEAGLAEAARLSATAGARTVLLEVSGPFHTQAVADAAPQLERALSDVEIVTPRVPTISNVSARPYGSPEEIRTLLVRQLTTRVQWRASVEWMWGEGARDFTDFGPGRVVAGLAQRITKTLTREVRVGA